MAEAAFTLQGRIPERTQDYLARRLDGARDLYLLALALGQRSQGANSFGRLIRESRIHFAAVIEECRIAGLDTEAMAEILGKRSQELGDSIRPEMWEEVNRLVGRRAPAGLQ